MIDGDRAADRRFYENFLICIARSLALGLLIRGRAESVAFVRSFVRRLVLTFVLFSSSRRAEWKQKREQAEPISSHSSHSFYLITNGAAEHGLFGTN